MFSFHTKLSVAVFCSLLVLFPTSVLAQECLPGYSALWSKIYLSSGSDPGGKLPIKVAPEVHFQEDSIVERSKWGIQLFLNPTEAAKRDNFYVYDLTAMTEKDVAAIAKHNSNIREEGADSLKVALVSKDKSNSHYSGTPVKMTGDLIWGIARAKGVREPMGFWAKYGIPYSSIPDSDGSSYDPGNSLLFASEIFSKSSDVDAHFVSCSSLGQVVKVGSYKISDRISAGNVSFAGLIALDERIDEIEPLLVGKAISDPIMMPFGESVEWAVEAEINF